MNKFIFAAILAASFSLTGECLVARADTSKSSPNTINTAQSAPETIKLTRAESAEFAVKNNLELKAVKAGIDAARGLESQLGRMPNPTIGAEYGNDMLFQNEGEYGVRAQISQKFPLFGRLSKEKCVGEIDVQLAQNEYLDAVRILSRQVELAYVDILEKLATLRLKEKLLKAMEELKDELVAASAKAEIPPLEAKRAQAECARLKTEIMTSAVELESQITLFKTALGLPATAKIEFADELLQIPASKVVFSKDTLEMRPDWRMFWLASESADAQIALAKAGRYDDVEIGVFFESNYEEDHPIGKTRYDALGLSISIPLPLDSKSGTISQKLALRRQAQLRAAAKENQIKNEIQVYRTKALEYANILSTQKQELESASAEIYAEYLQARKLAQASITDVFAAWQTNLEVKLFRTSLISQQAKSSIMLNYALGFNY